MQFELEFHLELWLNPFKEQLLWDGDLSSIDMARIIELLANIELIQYALACDPPKKSS